MATDSILGGLATELTAQEQAVALESIYTLLGAKATTVDVAAVGTKIDTLVSRAPALESGRVPVALPAGAATETTLAAVNTKIPALGQALAASAVPVVLTAAQQAALTPPAAITGFATETTLAAVSAKVPALSGGRTPVELPAATVATLTPPAAISGFSTETTLAAVNAKVPALSSGRTPVELPAAQVVTLTPPAAIAGFALEATQVTAGTKLDTLVTNSQPVSASGTISTQNLVPTGAATANSAVELTVAGRDTLLIQAVGTYTGALSIQATINGSTWVTLSGSSRILNQGTGAYSATIASATQSIFETSSSGFQKIRVTALSAVTGSVVVSVIAVDGNAQVALDTSLPAGSAVIGAVTGSGTFTTSGSSTNTPVAGSAYNVVTTAAALAAFLKASAGTLFEMTVSNLTNAIIYVKLYNKASAPVVASDVPAVTIPVAIGEAKLIEFGSIGKRFTTGIAIGVTGTAIATDATAVAAGAQIHATYV